MLTDKQVAFLREQLATAKKPLFFFDDDPDGLCSFLLLYKLHQEGHGTIVKSKPKIDLKFLRKVEEYQPDKIFVLDMPDIEQEFIDQVKLPFFWLDHHPPVERQHVNYFNPRTAQPDIYIPTTRLAFQVNPAPKNLWLAMVGCIADHHLPDFQPAFLAQYPHLMSKTANIEKIIYHDPLGRLIRLFAFILKGKTSEVNQCIRILARISSPDELLSQQTSQAKYLCKRFEKINQKYISLLEKAKKIRAKERLLLFVYSEQNWSFTSELSSELLYLNPDKIVLVARKKSGEMKCSLRSKDLPLPAVLEKALIGVEGYGGGHEFACGANVKEPDWQQFLANLKREIKPVKQ